MKRVMKIIGCVLLVIIVVLVLAFIWLSHKNAVPDEYWKEIDSSAETEERYNSPGTYSVESKKYEAPQDERDKDDNFFEVWYPEEEGTYPLLVMVNGTGVPCNKYEAVFEHIASYGYVVIGNNYGTNWDGKHPAETLQFALDTKEIAARIDTDKIAVGGHSQGGMGTFNAITEYENGSLYKAAFSLSPTNEELAIGLEWGFHLGTEEQYAFRLEEIDIPVLLAAGTGSFDNDTVSPLEKMQEEYAALAGDKVMFRKSGVDHGAMLYEANSYIIAWLDYYLKDKTENETVFYENEGELQSNENYQDFSSEKKAVN